MTPTLEARILQSSLGPVRDELRGTGEVMPAAKARSLVRGGRTIIAVVERLRALATEQAERGVEARTFAAFLRGAMTAVDEWLAVAPPIQRAVAAAPEPFDDRADHVAAIEQGITLARCVRDELLGLLRLAEKKGPPLDPAAVAGSGVAEDMDAILARLRAGADV